MLAPALRMIMMGDGRANFKAIAGRAREAEITINENGRKRQGTYKVYVNGHGFLTL